MARRNKKKRKVDGFVFPAPFAGIVILVSATALCYVWLGIRCEAVGREIKALEHEHQELEKRYQNEQYRWAEAKSPSNVDRALAKYGIKMDWPLRTQVIRMYEDRVPENRVAQERDLQNAYAHAGGPLQNE